MEAHPRGCDSSLSLRHGVRCVPEAGVSVEEVLEAIGEQVGCDNVVSASRMNKAVVVFLKEQNLTSRLVESGIWVSDVYTVISPLVSQSSRITISNCPPFIPNHDIEKELLRFGKIASGIKTVPLGCKNESLKHVMSFRRQVFMLLNSTALDISFRVMYEGKSYMLYASTGSLKCFECGEIGHKKNACPKTNTENNEPDTEKAGPSGSNVKAGPSGSKENDGEKDSVERSLDETEKEGDELERNETQNNQDVSCEETTEKNCGTGGERVEEAEVNVSQCEDETGCRNDHKGAVEVDDRDDEMEELGDDDSLSEMSDITSQSGDDQLYTVKEINDFLDETFGKTFDVKSFFPDVERFVRSAVKVQKSVGFEDLSRRKRFRLKKIVTKLRKRKEWVKKQYT